MGMDSTTISPSRLKRVRLKEIKEDRVNGIYVADFLISEIFLRAYETRHRHISRQTVDRLLERSHTTWKDNIYPGVYWHYFGHRVNQIVNEERFIKI